MSAAIIYWSATAAQGMLALAMLFATVRLVRGPRAQDRVLAMDTLFNQIMLMMLVLGVKMGSPHFFIANGPVSAVLATLAVNVLAVGIFGAMMASFRRSVEHERHLADHVRMIGALTKSAFERRAEMMMASASAGGQSLFLAYFDLDGFKRINDQHGHEAGDEVLRRFASAGKAALRREDCLGRMGGDEFAVLVPLAQTDSARAMAKRLHRCFNGALGQGGEVTCSMGVLIVPPDSRLSIKALLREVDLAMYAAKHSGKNAYQFAKWPPPLEPRDTMLSLPLQKEMADDATSAKRRTA